MTNQNQNFFDQDEDQNQNDDFFSQASANDENDTETTDDNFFEKQETVKEEIEDNRGEITDSKYSFASTFAEATVDKKDMEDKEVIFIDEKDKETEKEDSNEEEKLSDSVLISKTKLILIKELLQSIEDNGKKINSLLDNIIPREDEESIRIGQLGEVEKIESKDNSDEKVIEGIFDGEKMIGPDGKQYSIPTNYASKSKLVEGDMMKLTITNTGTFIYKQIGPIERIRVVGTLQKDSDGNPVVVSDELSDQPGQLKSWRVLPASITYFKGEVGDEVVLLLPKTGESQWGAVENVIRKAM